MKYTLYEYEEYLRSAGRSAGTIEKYLRDIEALLSWLNGEEITQAAAVRWKEYLLHSHAPVTVNSMLASLNSYCRFAGISVRIAFIKIQRKIFREENRELTRAEFVRLVETARNGGNARLAMLMETICASGIRVSEVKYITVEAVSAGRADITLKGKFRTILLPSKLCRALLKYAKKQKITSGEIFITGSGKSLSRRQIWAEMKHLCIKAGVEASKVFPHNLRHLFATSFYKVSHDIVRLADVLGHSSIETTRIYLMTTTDEHQRTLERMLMTS